MNGPDHKKAAEALELYQALDEALRSMEILPSTVAEMLESGHHKDLYEGKFFYELSFDGVEDSARLIEIKNARYLADGSGLVQVLDGGMMGDKFAHSKVLVSTRDLVLDAMADLEGDEDVKVGTGA